MATKLRKMGVTAGVLLGFCSAVTGPLYAQDFNKLPAEVYPLDQTYEELLQTTPNDIPVLVKHLRQDPNALRPSDALQPAMPQATPGGAVARNLLGVPQRGETLARRGRLRTVAGSQNRATAMIGDLFGGGTTTLTLTPTVAQAIPYASFPASGNDFNGFAALKLPNEVVGPFYGGVPTGMVLPPLSTIGIDTNGDNVVDTYPGLQQYGFQSGVALVGDVQDPGPFSGVVSGQTVVTAGGDTVPLINIQQPLTLVDVPSPAVGGAVGRVKIAENTSPMPRDRVFFNYSYFQNVPLTQTGINVNRFTPGFEKTFNEGTSSIEFRAPFATTLSSNVSATGISDGDKLEFGNISLTYKTLFYRDDDLAFSGGIQVGLPTADPVNVNLPDGTTIVKIKNQSVHLMPFLGALYTPNDRLFAQGFLQFDVAANGDDVLANMDLTKLQRVGSVQDSTYSYLDLSVGYWTYLADDQDAYLSGIAPMFEIHYNQSLQSGDVVRAPGNFQLGTFGNNFSVVNAVIGTTFQFGASSALTMGYAVPLGSGNDRQFDGEFRLFFNKRFGPQTRQTRAI